MSDDHSPLRTGASLHSSKLTPRDRISFNAKTNASLGHEVSAKACSHEPKQTDDSLSISLPSTYRGWPNIYLAGGHDVMGSIWNPYPWGRAIESDQNPNPGADFLRLVVFNLLARLLKEYASLHPVPPCLLAFFRVTGPTFCATKLSTRPMRSISRPKVAKT